MGFLSEITSGGITGLLKGAGEFAKDVRVAITGKEAMTAEQQTQLMMRASALEELALNADLQTILAQTEINKIEAASTDKFKSGWRPATGWVCVAGLAYTFIVRPLLPWIVGLTGYPVAPMPPIEMGELMVLLLGMLGLGGFRTFEKVKGVN